MAEDYIMKTGRKLPIGVQGFEGLIRDGYVYVDKTKYIYDLVHSGKQYFLSRPRRFGKSLLLSTIRAYWEGRKELFDGLVIGSMEEETDGAEDCAESGGLESWQPHPVFYFDFNRRAYMEKDALPQILDTILREYENVYGCSVERHRSLEERFQSLLVRAHEKTGRRCVILIDEYDKPLLETMENEELEEYNRKLFKGFFSTLKSFDDHIRFVFVTGVTKFSKVSIFSDLNQLNDISMNADYADICGITEKELISSFQPEIDILADEQGMSYEECLTRLREKYDGYHFHHKGDGLYNPFSLLKCFVNREFGSYWFETGTPTFLVKRLRAINFDVRQFSDRTLTSTQQELLDYQGDSDLDPVPLLYQTGYLTLTGYEREYEEYILGFPNEEVKYGFLRSLMPEYLPASAMRTGKDIASIRRYLDRGDLESLKNAFVALYDSIPYTTKKMPAEHEFQTVIYLVFTLLSQYVHAEVHSSRGRADCIVENSNYVYIFEFKRDKSANEALQQIHDRSYAGPYAADSRKIFKIGVNFSSEMRNISDWVVEE